MNPDSNRGTGRTTRMLERAIGTAVREDPVDIYVTCYSYDYAKELMLKTHSMIERLLIRNKGVNVDLRKVSITLGTSNLIFRRFFKSDDMQLRGRKVMIFEDHHYPFELWMEINK